MRLVSWLQWFLVNFAIKYNFTHCKSFVQGVSKVTYQYAGIISIICWYVTFKTSCIHFLTNLAQKYHEQIR